jgi:NADPH-dependent glutamate synthase beta subunit-like oxidoreductase
VDCRRPQALGKAVRFLDVRIRQQDAELVATKSATDVVGAGNTAMDAARVAKRMGAHATILYRRTKKFMPADEHELALALADGVTFAELAAPVKQADGVLKCEKMVLEINGPLSPVKLLPEDGKDFIYLVLPVRFKNEG